MKATDVMVRRPLTAGPDMSSEELRELMDTARIHHLPLLDGSRLVGLWLATESGPMVLIGPERVSEVDADDDAMEAMGALLSGSEAVLVREGERPVGLLTRTDAARLIERALASGMGVRRTHAVIIRLVGPPGSGKSTLLMRTIPLLRECEVGLVRSGDEPAIEEDQVRLGGAPIEHQALGRSFRHLDECIQRLGDVQAVLVEDHVWEPSRPQSLPGDYLVVVAAPDELEELAAPLLREASAVLVTKLDAAPAGFDLALARDELHRVNGRLEVIGVAPAYDDRGLGAWRRWLRSRVLPRQH